MSQTSPPLRPTGPQIHEFTKALETSFKAAALVSLLQRIDQDFEATAQSMEYKKSIFYMLSAASKGGWFAQLLAVVLEERPKDVAIQGVAIKLGLVHLPGQGAAYFEAIAIAPDRMVDAT